MPETEVSREERRGERRDLCCSVLCRSPWLWDDWLFSFTPTGLRWRRVLATLHGFTDKVIAERKAEIATSQTGCEDDLGRKKRLAFLDLLIEASEVKVREELMLNSLKSDRVERPRSD